MATTVAFKVRRQAPALIVPAEPTPREIKQLSDLDDQHWFRIHLPAVMIFRSNPLMQDKDHAAVLKVAVSRALVYYYPFAGRLFEEEENNKLSVDCNGEGVLFVEADANVTLEQLGDTIRQLPCPYIEELLHDVPAGSTEIVGSPLMLIQGTRLACGGFIFAIQLNHCVSNGFGLVQFVSTVAEMARGEPAPSVFPLWKREDLRARSQPRITCRHQEYEYEHMRDINQTIQSMEHDHDHLVSHTFFFGPREIKCIRKNLPSNNKSYSTFDIVSACIWRSRTMALQVEPNEVVMLTYMVNVGRKNILDLPYGYYGNSSVITSAVSEAGRLCTNPLGYALGLVKEAKSRVTKEYVISMMDLMVIKGRLSPLIIPWFFFVSDASRARFEQVDFGWGKAISGGISVEPWPHQCVYTSFRNEKGEEGILVPVCLSIEAMERFQKEIGKLTQEDGESQQHISKL